jgi:lysophospholipase L1-like esterase
MPKGRTGARIATAAALVGGAATALGGVVLGVLGSQVLMARWTIPGAEAPPPRCGGRYGREFSDAEPIRLAVLGDSTAAGYGVHTRAQTPGALLANAVAQAARRPVQLVCPAVVGSPSAWLPAQAETVVDAGVDLAVIFIGANDVTAGERMSKAVGYLAEAVRSLRNAGAQVVVATCPDLGTIRPIRPPLRWVARQWSRQMARAQRAAVEAAGATTVSLGDLLGPTFDADPERMFGPDRYHPSALGYEKAVAVVLPAVFAALRLPPTVDAALRLPPTVDAALRLPPTSDSASTSIADSASTSGGPASPLPAVPPVPTGPVLASGVTADAAVPGPVAPDVASA